MEPFRSIAITLVPHVSFLPFSLSQPPILFQPCTPSAGYHTVAAATTITSQHLHAFVETYDEHVTPILVPKPNVVVESMVVPLLEHETNTLPPKPNIVVALENIEENRIPLTPSILKLDAHLHEQTKQAKNKMKVRLNNNRRKKIPKLQLIDESSSSTGPYGGPCTQHSDLGGHTDTFTTIAGKKRKANQKVPTKTKLHLHESDSSLDTKEDKFDQQHIMNGADHAKLCDEYFGESRYTEKLHAVNNYDCGMFVMKYMQGVVMPTGVHKFDKSERFRLLVEVVNDSSNRIYIEVMNRLEQYKERYSRLQKARRKRKFD
ncbi:hypothetical protein LOK49_LG14G01303 [Camellia lanceoleosa]|uniref:Uncharacterized protein n=1 Tax=Camellia lanceoleosa TaxID=1840588 RepID=A0ACC0FDE4_9ERIC|nr:hypothetical protein LOK49_LG14G01303 [Camellia lanceoleosa]